MLRLVVIYTLMLVVTLSEASQSKDCVITRQQVQNKLVFESFSLQLVSLAATQTPRH